MGRRNRLAMPAGAHVGRDAIARPAKALVEPQDLHERLPMKRPVHSGIQLGAELRDRKKVDRSMRIRFAIVELWAAILLACFSSAALASDAVTFTRTGATYEDVRLELENAVIAEGLKIDYSGNIAAMLQRTGPDVGSNQQIYENAEFFTFCSAKLSRGMMAADPENMSQCPYIVFIYQRSATSKEVVVGYRKVTVSGPGAKALEEINTLLDRIARAATK